MAEESIFADEAEFAEARQLVLDLTGFDIAAGKASYGGKNIVYVFSETMKPSVIRISPASVKPRSAVHGEMMFIDYLSTAIRTVCNPVPFRNQLINTIHTGRADYYVVVSRKANGISPQESQFSDPHLFELYGDKIGELHAASREGAREGFRYPRPLWYEAPGFDFRHGAAEEWIPAAVMDRMLAVREKVRELPVTEESFGLIHGDMSPFNTFVDWDDVWLFDFDDSCYHYYFYDVACFMMQALRGQRSTNPSFDGLNIFLTAYGKHNRLPQEYLKPEMLELFIQLRLASALWQICTSQTQTSRARAEKYSSGLGRALLEGRV